ncbi:MAG: HAD family hydrolase, partial [Faecalibacillus sp.]
MIKLVVLDVDGTSIDRDNQFYDDDIKEIDFYKKKGIEFMFASGRDMNM